MKVIIFCCALLLLLNTFSTAEIGLNQQVQNNQKRIDQLEDDLAEMLVELQDIRNQLVFSSPTQTSVDPLVGKWRCTNNLYSYNVFFSSNGRVVQEEAVLGNTKVNNWTRVGDEQIVFADGFLLRTEFESENELSIENINTNMVWKCLSIDE
jgi:hypothetical protein